MQLAVAHMWPFLYCCCRDIKPENILFDEGILKVADFGLALNINEENAVTRAGEGQHHGP
jgi:aurora kinase